MENYQFPAEYETSIFINQSNGVTISQTSTMGEIESVMFLSRKRCEEVGHALIAMAKSATLDDDGKDQS